MYAQNTANPTQKHPISWPELESGPIELQLESGQIELQPGQPGPQLGNIFEKWTKLF